MDRNVFSYTFSNHVPPYQPSLDLASGNSGPSPTVPEVLHEFIESRKAKGVSDGYLVSLNAMSNVISRNLIGPIAKISPSDLDRFFALLTCSPVTKNNYLRFIRMACKFGRKRKRIPGWYDSPDVVEPVIEPPQEFQFYTPEEIRTILNALPEHARQVAVLVCFCGVRTAEAIRLSWENIDFDRGFVNVSATKAKTRARRLAPLTDASRAWLKPKEGRIWPGTRLEFAKLLRSSIRGAKMKPKRNGLRHSFISYRLADVKNENQVALEAGNSPEVIFRNYRELVAPGDVGTYWMLRPGDDQRELKNAA